MSFQRQMGLTTVPCEVMYSLSIFGPFLQASNPFVTLLYLRLSTQRCFMDGLPDQLVEPIVDKIQ